MIHNESVLGAHFFEVELERSTQNMRLHSLHDALGVVSNCGIPLQGAGAFCRQGQLSKVLALPLEHGDPSIPHICLEKIPTRGSRPASAYEARICVNHTHNNSRAHISGGGYSPRGYPQTSRRISCFERPALHSWRITELCNPESTLHTNYSSTCRAGAMLSRCRRRMSSMPNLQEP